MRATPDVTIEARRHGFWVEADDRHHAVDGAGPDDWHKLCWTERGARWAARRMQRRIDRSRAAEARADTWNEAHP